MKHTIYVILILTLFFAGCFGKNPKISTGHEGKPMPSINLLLVDSITRLNTKDIRAGDPVVLFYFSPHCPYCRALTKEIIDNIENLNGIQFYMLSNFPLNDIRIYKNEYQLENYHNITVAQDYQVYFSNYFKAPGVPCVAIYGKDRILKQVVIGNVSTNLIKDVAFE